MARVGWLCSIVAVSLLGCSAYDDALLKRLGLTQEPTSDSGMAPGEDAGMIVEPVDCKDSASVVECMVPNADAVCIDRQCTIVRCQPGFVDCDGDDANGCEGTLDSVENCGACNAACALPNVLHHRCAAADSGRRCEIDKECGSDVAGCDDPNAHLGCAQGFGDCDGNPANGCETVLNTLANCGGCGVVCSSAERQADCRTGTCSFIGCAAGFGDCRDDGCEQLFEDEENCGSCGNACTGATDMCAGGRCTSMACDEGTADCDGDDENGCETALDSADNCRGCGMKCGPYPAAEAACVEGQCAIGECDEGRADCDGDRGNGCEIDLGGDALHCGGCGNDCAALPHVESGSCAAGTCRDLVCEAGFDDCDGRADNGCEQPLNTLAHCGACGVACAPANATAECDTGTCMITTCNTGREECNGNMADGCEANLGSRDHCGRCNNKCPTGTTCTNGGCGCGGAGDCPQGFECCDGACIDTGGSCVWWPCIPGTSRDMNHCGGCGERCTRLACCG